MKSLTFGLMSALRILFQSQAPKYHRGGWELIDSHGAGTVVCPFITGRGIGTETCEMDNVFPPDDL